MLDALILKLYSSILDCVKRFLTQLSIFLIILIFQFPQSVRQHALSMLTDSIIDRHGKFLAPEVLCKIFKDICVPLVGERIKALLEASAKFNSTNGEDILIELELCISLLFKPFLHHLQRILSIQHEFEGIWVSLLGVMTLLLGESLREQGDYDVGPLTLEKVLWTTKELGSEHLRNSILVLSACGVLNNPETGGISALTWTTIDDMNFCDARGYISEWKASVASQSPTNM